MCEDENAENRSPRWRGRPSHFAIRAQKEEEGEASYRNEIVARNEVCAKRKFVSPICAFAATPRSFGWFEGFGVHCGGTKNGGGLKGGDEKEEPSAKTALRGASHEDVLDDQSSCYA